MKPTVRILDTTLRDGSYVINFQFTSRDTEVIAGALERAGFDLIEVGHGIGLGAVEAGAAASAESDVAHMEAAAKTLKRADWGMFCIPGIARVEQLDVAAEHGMGFVRIGTNVDDVPQSRSFIERAKRHGMFVCANYMKSYAADPSEFARRAKMSQDYGADVVYIVDSAGGMMTKDLEDYFTAVREVSDIKIGFHGHDNLGLAVANSVRAAELGAYVIDTSLQGMGRSAGNTPTELFIVVMERLGRKLGFDPLQILDISETYVKPLIQRSGYSSIDVVAGYAQFHSSYMSVIREFSSKYGVDPRKLIIALCERDRVNAPRQLVEDIAKSLSQESDCAFSARFHLNRYYGSEQLPLPTKSV
jgi:4-hydroxy 2-oxovalerate aldolase